MSDEPVRQVVLHPAIWEPFLAWIRSHDGLDVARLPDEDDGLPTFVVVLREWSMR